MKLAITNNNSLVVSYLLRCDINDKSNKMYVLDKNISQDVFDMLMKKNSTIVDMKYIRRSTDIKLPIQLNVTINNIHQSIQQCLQFKNYSEALAWYEIMKTISSSSNNNKKIVPNIETFQILLPYFTQKQKWNELCYLISEMKCYLNNNELLICYDIILNNYLQFIEEIMVIENTHKNKYIENIIHDYLFLLNNQNKVTNNINKINNIITNYFILNSKYSNDNYNSLLLSLV